MLILFRQPKMKHFSDVLNWLAMPEDSIIVTKQSELMACIRYRPRDLASSSPEQLVNARQALNNAILRFDRGWCVQFEAQRYETRAYDDSTWPDELSLMLDKKRRGLFETPGTQHMTEFYCTILYSPPDDAVGKLSAQFEHASKEERSDKKRINAEVDKFKHRVAEFIKHISAIMPEVEILKGSDLLSYLHSAICTRILKTKPQPFPIYIAEYLVDEDVLGGRKPMLGDHHIRVVRIKTLADETSPGLFDSLNELSFPFRRVSRWIPMDRDDAQREIELRKKNWADKRTSLVTKMLSRWGRDDDTRDNEAAKLNFAMADLALVELATTDASFGYWSHYVVLMHLDLDVLEQRVKDVRHIFEGIGFRAPVATDDSMACWIGSLPGHPHADLGRFLGCSLTFSEISPATAVWQGPEKDHHLNGPPLIRCMSAGGTPFRFCLHQPGTDLSHIFLVGMSGAGKSTLLGAMIVGHRKYDESQVILLDKDASSRCIVLALGGTFHSLAAGDDSISLQPLAYIDNPSELAWAVEWIIYIRKQRELHTTPEQEKEITLALKSLASFPVYQRTLTIFRGLVQDNDVKLSISPFCKGGAHGDLLDSNHMNLGFDTDVTCFEMGALLKLESAVGPVLSCVFHEIQKKFTGRPTLFCIDEAGTCLDHEIILKNLRADLKQGRKKNLSVVLSTQSIVDITSTKIREVIFDSCQNRIYTANGSAMEKDTYNSYIDSGLTHEKIKIISNLIPKREYAFEAKGQNGGWRKAELCLSDLELAFYGRNRPKDQREMDRILREYSREEFVEQWMKYCGIDFGPHMKTQYLQAAE